MEIQERIHDFAQLGALMGSIGKNEPWPGHSCGLTDSEFSDLNSLVIAQKHHNGWFTEENVRQSMRAWSKVLTLENLSEWMSNYDFGSSVQQSVGVIMAGNIPMVGMHDMLSVLLSGHRLVAKTASDDAQLLRAIATILSKLNPKWKARITFIDGKMTDYDAIIATGSNNSARYFRQYFSHVPHIIRKNRNAVAILSGTESEQDMEALGSDVFSYFGLGCRNVSKLYVPMDFDLQRIFKAVYPFHEIIHHHKYANNYDYHKAIYMLNGDQLLENGFMLLKESEELIASPVSTLFYARYDDKQALKAKLASRSEEIQCIVSMEDIPFGQAQNPALDDYADGVDTMNFLCSLKKPYL